MKYLKNNVIKILVCLLLGGGYSILSGFLKTNLLQDFLTKDLLTLLVALVAIYIPTIAIMLGKLDQLKIAHPYFNPKNLILELKVFIKEMIFYIVIVMFVMMLYRDSPLLIQTQCINIFIPVKHIFSALLFAVLIANIKSLYDLCTALIISFSSVIDSDE